MLQIIFKKCSITPPSGGWGGRFLKARILWIAFVLLSVSSFAAKPVRLVILHTNDTHSQVEPSESNNMGGYARRMGVINKIRSEEPNVLLVDAGDFSQGSPYFNFFNGRIETKALEMMGYDALTLGNHEFDNGLDTLAAVLKLVKLPVVNANYDLKNTPIAPFVKPYIIVRKGGLKIGIFGVGVNLNGLAFQKNFAGLILNDPLKTASETSNYLKNSLKCDLVICLSHLGTSSEDSSPTDYDLVAASRNINVVVGGHSHKILENVTAENASGRKVLITQMGKSGLNLGRIDLTFEKK
ncbi:MAG: metallophosphoesterase [Bacteroidetes bacterium]|nr:metallophosphoesterase [Bacteroidota bacterium]